MMQKYKPEDDGITHINIYSRGKTRLGRMLSNFSKSKFTHPKYGEFNSIEGFWYYIKFININEDRKEGLRYLYGYAAKQLGRQLEKDLVPDKNTDFIKLVKEAITLKIMQDNEIKELLSNTSLPLTHYYLASTGYPIIPKNVDWVVEHIESVRTNLQRKVVS